MSVIIYTRTSTSKQEISHDNQINACMRWIESQGLHVKGIFNETVSGAKSLEKRDILLDAIACLEEGDVFCVYRRDRLGRDLVQNAIADKIIISKGARVHSLDSGSNDTPEGQLLQQILDVFATYERMLIQVRTKEALKMKKQKGQKTGNPSLGKKHKDGKVVTDRKEQSKINKVRAMRQSGLSFKEITKRCKDQGIISRRGNVPSHATLVRWCKGIQIEIERNLEGRTPRSCIENTKAGLKATVIDLRRQGMSVRHIAHELNERGYTTSKGNPISHTQVLRIIKRQSELLSA